MSTLGAIGLAALGTGCSSADPYDLIRRFPTTTIVPGRIRLPMSIGRKATVIVDERKAPASLHGGIADANGTTVVDGLTAERQLINAEAPVGLRSPYYSFTADLKTIGQYTLFVDGGAPNGAAFQINDPTTVLVPVPGSPMPSVKTPTTTDGAGVDPICTRTPACPFHAVSLDAALTSGKPVVYMIGTPAYCQTGVCGPELETLIRISERYADRVTFIHAEVYTDETLKSAAPAVDAAKLDFEPVLFVVDASGTVSDRLDAVFGDVDIAAAIDTVLA